MAIGAFRHSRRNYLRLRVAVLAISQWLALGRPKASDAWAALVKMEIQDCLGFLVGACSGRRGQRIKLFYTSNLAPFRAKAVLTPKLMTKEQG